MTKLEGSYQIPTATVEIGDQQYHLRMTIGALKRLREAAGGDLTGLAAQGEDAVYRVPAMVYALMTREDRDRITLEDFEEEVGVGHVAVLSEAIVQLQNASLPASEGTSDPLGKPERKTVAKA